MTNETGTIIKALRDSRGMTQQQLAEIVGAKTYTTITKWESGDNFPKGKDIITLSEFFKVSSDFILGLEDSSKLIPRIQDYDYYPVSVAAGLPSAVDYVTEANVESISVPDSIMGKWAGHEDIYMMRVNGESMNKIFPTETIIAVKRVEVDSLKDDDIVVFSDENEYSVKRFYDDKDNQRYIFRPDSKDRRFLDYSVSYESAKNLTIHGKVVVYIVELD